MANNFNNRKGGSNAPRVNNETKRTATSERPAASTPVTSKTPAPNNGGPRRLTPKQEAMLRRQRIRRRNQLIFTSLLVIVVVALIGVIVYVTNQSSKVTVTDKASTTTADTAPFTIGNPNSKVTLTEWGDFRCSACDLFFNNVEPTIMDQYVKTNKIQFNFKNFITIDQPGTIGDSHHAAEAAWCAADQSHFWDYYQQLYKNYPGETPGYWTIDRLKNVASQLGLDTNKFNSCLDSNQHRQDVTNQNQQASQNGYSGTPTITINGKPITSNFSDVNGIKGELDAAIAAANGTTPGAGAASPNTTPGSVATTTAANGTPVATNTTTAANNATTSSASTTTTAANTTTSANGTPVASPTK